MQSYVYQFNSIMATIFFPRFSESVPQKAEKMFYKMQVSKLK